MRAWIRSVSFTRPSIMRWSTFAVKSRDRPSKISGRASRNVAGKRMSRSNRSNWICTWSEQIFRFNNRLGKHDGEPFSKAHGIDNGKWLTWNTMTGKEGPLHRGALRGCTCIACDLKTFRFLGLSANLLDLCWRSREDGSQSLCEVAFRLWGCRGWLRFPHSEYGNSPSWTLQLKP